MVIALFALHHLSFIFKPNYSLPGQFTILYNLPGMRIPIAQKTDVSKNIA